MRQKDNVRTITWACFGGSFTQKEGRRTNVPEPLQTLFLSNDSVNMQSGPHSIYENTRVEVFGELATRLGDKRTGGLVISNPVEVRACLLTCDIVMSPSTLPCRIVPFHGQPGTLALATTS